MHQDDIKVPVLSSADKARLMLNLPDLANRWVEFNGKRFPILHLGIGDLERFRSACEPIEKLYLQFYESKLPVLDFMRIYKDEILNILKNAVPAAASIVLGVPEDTIIASCCPLAGFSVVLAQWLHNLEIGSLQAIFPPPPSDEEDKELEGDPSAMNPMSIVQKMASAYHWPKADILATTVPQVYLMGNDSAWSYATIKSDSAKDIKSNRKSAPIVVDGKKRENFKGMTAQEYKAYVQTTMGGMPIVPVGGI